MKKTFMDIVFYIGFLFFGGGFLIAFGQFILYNGMGEIFEYIKADNAEIIHDTNVLNKMEITDILYRYTVNNDLYEMKESIATSSIKKKNIHINEIYYNKLFPSLSYVGDNNLSLRKAKTGMITMGFFFLFIFLIYKFADMDKWIGVYTRGEYKSSRKKS